MKCQICNNEATETLNIINIDYNICGWCAGRINHYIDGNIKQSIINIAWGGGRIGWNEWFFLRDFLRKHNIKEILEFGTGLSTELFVNEGLKVTTLDATEYHSELYSRLIPIKPYVNCIYYSYGSIPKLNRTWDFVFVDGYHRREQEVKTAMEVSNRFIMLHDPNLGEEDFFPNENWVEVDNRIYEKVCK